MDEGPVLSIYICSACSGILLPQLQRKGHSERAYCVCFVHYFIRFFFFFFFFEMAGSIVLGIKNLIQTCPYSCIIFYPIQNKLNMIQA